MASDIQWSIYTTNNPPTHTGVIIITQVFLAMGTISTRAGHHLLLKSVECPVFCVARSTFQMVAIAPWSQIQEAEEQRWYRGSRGSASTNVSATLKKEAFVLSSMAAIRSRLWLSGAFGVGWLCPKVMFVCAELNIFTAFSNVNTTVTMPFRDSLNIFVFKPCFVVILNICW